MPTGSCQQQPPGGAEQHATRPIPATAIPRTSSWCSDAYPTVTAMAADLILPTAMWVEKEGAYGNAERRTHFWHQLVNAPGEARSDLWQLMEFSKRFTTDEVWPAEMLARNPEYRGKTLFDVLFRNGQVDTLSARARSRPTTRTRNRKHFGFYVQKGLFEEYATFGRGHGHDLAPFDAYHQVRGPALAGGRRQGDALALPRGARPVCQAGRGRAVLRQTPTARRTSSPRRTSRRRNRPTRNTTSGSSPAACWSTGIPAR